MLTRKSTAKSRAWRFGAPGDFLDVMPEDINASLRMLPFTETLQPFSPPARRHRFCRVAIHASPGVYQGFAWHNACIELTPANWRTVLREARPDYLLVESCIRSSSGLWPIASQESLARQLADFADLARRTGAPSIYWHTSGVYPSAIDIECFSHFDIVASANEEICESLRRMGLDARHLPLAFSPEQFNPFSHPRIAPQKYRLLFDGMARMLREPATAAILEGFVNENLAIFDSRLLVPAYNIERFSNRKLAKAVVGNLSQTLIQELYKQEGAYLLIGAAGSGASQGLELGALQAKACGLPVIRIGQFCGAADCGDKQFQNVGDALEYWRWLRQNPFEREREGHLAWRCSHQENTFLHRMKAIHSWLGFQDPMPDEKASIITPSMRRENFTRALAQYESQSWPEKEFIYVFNGRREQTPALEARPDVKILNAPEDQATGLAMNAGLAAASGDCIFRFDDDDLYGKKFAADRMIHFREFAIDSLSSARVGWTFGNGVAKVNKKAEPPEDNTLLAFGSAMFRLAAFPGGSIALRREFASRINFADPAYAHADVSLLGKAMIFAPASAHLRTNAFNMCVVRGDPGLHTWSASKEEIENWLEPDSLPLEKIFV